MKFAEEEILKLTAGKKVALWGRGVSTKSAEKLLENFGVECVYYGDAEDDEKFDSSAASRHALAVYSPAFKPSHPFFEAAKSGGVRTLGEPDLGGLLWRGRIIAITGTNGKTTLTSFLAHALKKAGIESLPCGNIGQPICDFAAQSFGKTAVCEISSFQAMRLSLLRPDALLWTNFAPDHLDWHADLREYFEAKLRLAKLLKSDVFIYGSGISQAAQKYALRLPDFARFADKKSFPDAPHPFDNSIQRENFALACSLFDSLKLDKKILFEACADFKLAPHRFAKVCSIGSVNFWNDSKATNAHAAIAALRELKGKKIFWIGGGKNKFCDNSELVKTLSDCAQGAALIGQSAEILKRELPDMPLGVEVCENLDEAVKLALDKCRDFGEVLFSPAFSSFGMFNGYAERGKSFERAVLCLKNQKNGQ